jgi:hypothetical protein
VFDLLQNDRAAVTSASLGNGVGGVNGTGSGNAAASLGDHEAATAPPPFALSHGGRSSNTNVKAALLATPAAAAGGVDAGVIDVLLLNDSFYEPPSKAAVRTEQSDARRMLSLLH